MESILLVHKGWLESMDSGEAMLSVGDSILPLDDSLGPYGGNCLHCLHTQYRCRMVTIASR